MENNSSKNEKSVIVGREFGSVLVVVVSIVVSWVVSSKSVVIKSVAVEPVLAPVLLSICDMIISKSGMVSREFSWLEVSGLEDMGDVVVVVIS